MDEIDLSIEQIEQIHSLVLKSNTPQDIAALTSIPLSKIRQAIARYFPHLAHLQLYKEHKKDIFRGLQSMAVGYLIQKMPYAAFNNIVDLLKVLEDKIALLEGRSNFNLGINVRIEDLVAQKEKMLNELRKQGIPENQIENEFRKLTNLPAQAALPAPQATIPIKAPAGIVQHEIFSSK